MSLKVVQYTPIHQLDPISKKPIEIYKPILSIRLGYGHKVDKYLMDCLVDSGSDHNLFPAEWGEAVGIKTKKGIPVPILGRGNNVVNAYRHRVKIYLLGLYYDVDADFSDEHQVPLLGRIGFFDCFKKITFNNDDSELELEI